jgi:hypothetical protein
MPQVTPSSSGDRGQGTESENPAGGNCVPVPCTSRRPEAIAATYDNDDNRTAVLTPEPDVTSATYDVKGGLREGAVLPPCLYNIFMAGLTRELKAPGNKQHGMHVGKEWMGAQMWADDLVHIILRGL